MKHEKDLSIFDILVDETNTDTIELYGEKDKKVEFEQIAIIPMDEGLFCILRPITKMEGVADDEALAFECTDLDTLEVVEDDKLINKIFEEYYKLLEE